LPVEDRSVTDANACIASPTRTRKRNDDEEDWDQDVDALDDYEWNEDTESTSTKRAKLNVVVPET
jgi:hypothetical protein